LPTCLPCSAAQVYARDKYHPSNAVSGHCLGRDVRHMMYTNSVCVCVCVCACVCACVCWRREEEAREGQELQHPWWYLSTILGLLDPRFRPQPSNLGINLGSNLISNPGRKTEINGSPSPTSGLPHIRPIKSPLSLGVRRRSRRRKQEVIQSKSANIFIHVSSSAAVQLRNIVFFIATQCNRRAG